MRWLTKNREVERKSEITVEDTKYRIFLIFCVFCGCLFVDFGLFLRSKRYKFKFKLQTFEH